MGKTYAYKIVKGSLGMSPLFDEKILYELSLQGWELVSVYVEKGNLFKDGYAIYWLKREGGYP